MLISPTCRGCEDSFISLTHKLWRTSQWAIIAARSSFSWSNWSYPCPTQWRNSIFWSGRIWILSLPDSGDSSSVGSTLYTTSAWSHGIPLPCFRVLIKSFFISVQSLFLDRDLFLSIDFMEKLASFQFALQAPDYELQENRDQVYCIHHLSPRQPPHRRYPKNIFWMNK